MLIRLLSFLKGYLLISVTGAFPERFVNLCTLRGIYIWGARRSGDATVMKTSVRGFMKMAIPAKRSGCRVRIIKKVGVPFKLKRFSKRKMLIGGFAFFCAVVAILNSFVWVVRIDGNENMTTEEIKFITESCGLKQGVIKYSLDKKKFSEKVLNSEPRLLWVWPEIRGTVVYVHVREKIEHEPPVDVKKPCNVIASRSGIINKMLVKRGWACVAEGDSVVAGQMLIASKHDELRAVHAEGEVIASWWEEVTKEAPSEITEIRKTGKRKSYYTLIIGKFGMTARFSSKAPYNEFEKKETESKISLWRDVTLPVTVKKTTYIETEKSTEKLTQEKANEIAEKKITEEFERNITEGVIIKDKTVKCGMGGDGKNYVSVVFQCEADIALTDYANTEE